MVALEEKVEAEVLLAETGEMQVALKEAEEPNKKHI